jgi:hypothetical protein
MCLLTWSVIVGMAGLLQVLFENHDHLRQVSGLGVAHMIDISHQSVTT